MFCQRSIGSTIVILFIVASIVIEMCSYKKLFKPAADDDVLNYVQSHQQDTLVNSTTVIDGKKGYLSGLYYSNWSPYPPRKHFPHDIDLSKISHIYYAFFLVDGSTGKLKSGDEWSDFQMDLYKPMALKLNKLNPTKNDIDISKKDLPKGCLGELFYLRHTKMLSDNRVRNFKVIMCVGGWSNRDEFPKMVKDPKKVENFISSCVDTMFKYGFDGIDLDWEFPEDDGFEPRMYLELMKRLRLKFDELETTIFGKQADPKHPKFQLSVATPAFEEKLNILPISEMDQYVDIWNMMTYDYYGEWSEVTGYHSNLYNGTKNTKSDSLYKHSHTSNRIDGLAGNTAVYDMINLFGVDSRKIVLGMAAYGRGFTHVKVSSKVSRFIDKPFHGVGGASEGEPGMWLYNQLPIKGSKEQFDPDFVSAFCFDSKTSTFVGYDNVDSVRVKAHYVKDMNLAGGFWWESCGDDHKNPKRSLLNAFTKEIDSVTKFDDLIYRQPETLKYYLEKFGDSGFLSPILSNILAKGDGNY